MAYDPMDGGMRRPARKADPSDDSWVRKPVRKTKAQAKPVQQVQQQSRPARKISPLYDDFDSFYDEPVRETPGKRKRSGKHRLFWTVVFFLAMGLQFALACVMAPQLLGRQLIELDFLPTVAFDGGTVLIRDEAAISSFQAMRDLVSTDRLMNGITIDGVDVGGMTLSAARKAVQKAASADSTKFKVVVKSNNQTWTIDQKSVPISRNTEQVLRIAYAAGRQTTDEGRTGRMTPVQQKRNAVLRLNSQPLTLKTTLTWDKDAVMKQCQKIAKAVTVAPVNASVKSFNFKTKQFTVNADKNGTSLDAKALYDKVAAVLSSKKRSGTVTMEPEVVKASVRKAALEKNLGKISSFTTTTTSNKNRNTNVRLSAEAINGTVVKPGYTFSFNKTTGERTAAKGYKQASAISGGATNPEIGGGVCQTSSTLFNAVMRANMEIVTRSPHAWPSSYVPQGMDATVNWPGLDFQFRNPTDWPIYIVAYYNNRKITVEVYGYTLGAGVTIDLEHKRTKTMMAPTGVKEVQNTSLPAGTRKKTVSARNGSVWETYRVWYKNGKEYKRELLCTSTYKVYQETVEYN